MVFCIVTGLFKGNNKWCMLILHRFILTYAHTIYSQTAICKIKFTLKVFFAGEPHRSGLMIKTKVKINQGWHDVEFGSIRKIQTECPSEEGLEQTYSSVHKQYTTLCIWNVIKSNIH